MKKQTQQPNLTNQYGSHLYNNSSNNSLNNFSAFNEINKAKLSNVWPNDLESAKNNSDFNDTLDNKLISSINNHHLNQ